MTTPLSHNKVVVADDEGTIRRVLSIYLRAAGYEVILANDGFEALRCVQEHSPSFLITDWQMPGLSGIELCRRVRALELPNYLYTIFVTVRSSEHDVVSAMDAGADDFLIKPLHRSELVARLSAGRRVLQLMSRLTELAAIDPLTELPTRREFLEVAAKQWHVSRRGQSPLSVAVLDIDYFKAINDTYGHPVGDDVLRGLAEIMRQGTRVGDFVCRYGGEEFCVVLPATIEQAATSWAENLRDRIANTTLTCGPQHCGVTVSIGVAEMQDGMEDMAELLATADQCLMAAKSLGRNRVTSPSRLARREGAWQPANVAGDAEFEGVLARHVMTPLIHFLRPNDLISTATGYFLRYRVASAPVIDDNGKLVGILSEKDIIGLSPRTDTAHHRVADAMHSNIVAYDENDPFVRILRFLQRATMRSIVVTASGAPVGVISRSVALRWLHDVKWRGANANGAATYVNVDRSHDPLPALFDALTRHISRLGEHVREEGEQRDAGAIVAEASRAQGLIVDLLSALGAVQSHYAGVFE